MPRKLLRDMVVIKHQKKKAVKLPESEKEEIHFDLTHLDETKPKQAKTNNTKYSLWIVAVVPIVFFLFSLSYLFSHIAVVIDPKIQEVVLNENLSAVMGVEDADQLSFDLVVISGEETKTIIATEEKDISEKARGRVKIFNNYSSATQRLDVDTRLEGSNSRLYKTEKRIVVPGRAVDGTPGSVEVGIYADQAGEESNASLLDFTIVGFKGTSKYDKFDVRSVPGGEPAGGAEGKYFAISELEKENTITELRGILKARLFQKAIFQVPDGFIMFKEAVFLKVNESNASAFSPESRSSISIKGTIYGILLDEAELARRIIEDTIEESDGAQIYIQNIKDLDFVLSNKLRDSIGDDTLSFQTLKNIDFNLSGRAKAVWRINIKDLTNDLLGRPKRDFNQILSQHPSIDFAELSISPFWRRSIPEDPEKVEIIVNYPR